MFINKKTESIIETISKLNGYICHGLVNYKLGVSALNENSSPNDESNFFPMQCTSIINATIKSVANLNGGVPKYLQIEANNMIMIIYLINDTYFCGIGLNPGSETNEAHKKLVELKNSILSQI